MIPQNWGTDGDSDDRLSYHCVRILDGLSGYRHGTVDAALIPKIKSHREHWYYEA